MFTEVSVTSRRAIHAAYNFLLKKCGGNTFSAEDLYNVLLKADPKYPLSFARVRQIMGEEDLRTNPKGVKDWTDGEIGTLKKLFHEGMPQPQIALALGRTVTSTRAQISRLREKNELPPSGRTMQAVEKMASYERIIEALLSADDDDILPPEGS